MALFHIDKYRDIYIKHDKIPNQWLTGCNIMVYTGKIITKVKGVPETYDRKKDYFFACDCDYPHWKEIRKI